MKLGLFNCTPAEYLADRIWTACPCVSQRGRHFYQHPYYEEKYGDDGVELVSRRYFRAAGPVSVTGIPGDSQGMDFEYERAYHCEVCASPLVRSFRAQLDLGEQIQF